MKKEKNLPHAPRRLLSLVQPIRGASLADGARDRICQQGSERRQVSHLVQSEPKKTRSAFSHSQSRFWEDDEESCHSQEQIRGGLLDVVTCI